MVEISSLTQKNQIKAQKSIFCHVFVFISVYSQCKWSCFAAGLPCILVFIIFAIKFHLWKSLHKYPKWQVQKARSCKKGSIGDRLITLTKIKTKMYIFIYLLKNFMNIFFWAKNHVPFYPQSCKCTSNKTSILSTSHPVVLSHPPTPLAVTFFELFPPFSLFVCLLVSSRLGINTLKIRCPLFAQPSTLAPSPWWSPSGTISVSF